MSTALIISCTQQSGGLNNSFVIQKIDSPAASGSGEPNLFAADDGRIFMSWIQKTDDKNYSLRFSIYEENKWSKSQTIAEGRDWFVNWADFPSLVAFPDGSLAAHWLKISGKDTYAYDVNIARSTDGGKNWGKPIVPHSDGTQTEHGFVSMLPWIDNQVFITWLDGRNFSKKGDTQPTNEMTFRFAALDNDGNISNETVLDSRVCDCCQTSAALTSDGAVVAYRDRSQDEIRDISFVRFHNGKWTEPKTLYEDGWEIKGCPVNGPSVDADGQRVAIAWFTAPGDSLHVRVAFSNDGGANFGKPIKVDDGDPVGRVDVTLLADGSAFVSWMEHAEEGGEIRVRRIRPDGSLDSSIIVAESSTSRASGFPQIACNDNEIIFAWTETGQPSTVHTAVAKYE